MVDENQFVTGTGYQGPKGVVSPAMTFQQYLESPQRKASFLRATPTNNLPPLKERLKRIHHSDVCNWAEIYNGGIIPEGLQ